MVYMLKLNKWIYQIKVSPNLEQDGKKMFMILPICPTIFTQAYFLKYIMETIYLHMKNPINNQQILQNKNVTKFSQYPQALLGSHQQNQGNSLSLLNIDGFDKTLYFPQNGQPQNETIHQTSPQYIPCFVGQNGSKDQKKSLLTSIIQQRKTIEKDCQKEQEINKPKKKSASHLDEIISSRRRLLKEIDFADYKIVCCRRKNEEKARRQQGGCGKCALF